MLFRGHIGRAHGRLQGGLNAPAGTTSGDLNDSVRAQQLAAWGALAGLAAFLTGPVARQWLAHALANICILGGIVGAPCISVLAWVGMILPTRAPLHEMAPTLMTGALIWLGLAIVGAHAFRLDRRDRDALP